MAESSPLAVALGRRHPVYWTEATTTTTPGRSPTSMENTIVHLPTTYNPEGYSTLLSLYLASSQSGSSSIFAPEVLLFRPCDLSFMMDDNNDCDTDEPKYLRKALADNDKKCFSKSCPRVMRRNNCNHLPTPSTTTSTVQVLSEILEDESKHSRWWSVENNNKEEEGSYVES